MANYGFKGWVKLWREEMHNPLYFDEPFTKWQAWMDLYMMADDKNTVRTSLETLKTRWLWGSTTKVRNYLNTVSNMGLATVKSTPNKGTQIVINTSFFATDAKKKNTAKNTAKNTVSKTEELLPKEVDRASFEVSPSNNNYKQLNEELDDEYK